MGHSIRMAAGGDYHYFDECAQPPQDQENFSRARDVKRLGLVLFAGGGLVGMAAIPLKSPELAAAGFVAMEAGAASSIIGRAIEGIEAPAE